MIVSQSDYNKDFLYRGFKYEWQFINFEDLMYQVLRAMKKYSPYIAVFQILLPVLDPNQSCVFLKFKQTKKNSSNIFYITK